MIIETQDVAGVTVLDVSGRLTFGKESQDLNQAVKLLVGAGNAKILIDLAGLTYIDSCGVGELIAAFTTVTKAGGALKLVSPQDQVLQVLRIVRLPAIIELYDSRDEALQSFG